MIEIRAVGQLLCLSATLPLLCNNSLHPFLATAGAQRRPELGHTAAHRWWPIHHQQAAAEGHHHVIPLRFSSFQTSCDSLRWYWAGYFQHKAVNVWLVQMERYADQVQLMAQYGLCAFLHYVKNCRHGSLVTCMAASHKGTMTIVTALSCACISCFSACCASCLSNQLS